MMKREEESSTPLMLDGTYLSRNFATLGPLPDSRRVVPKFSGWTKESFRNSRSFLHDLIFPELSFILNDRQTRSHLWPAIPSYEI